MEAKGISQWFRHTANYIGRGLLEGNKKILSAYPEKFSATSGILSPFEAASHYAHTPGATVADSLANTFLKDTSQTIKKGAKEATYDWSMNNLNKKKLALGMSGIGITAGIAGGLTHDTAGNIDIAGLPGI